MDRVTAEIKHNYLVYFKMVGAQGLRTLDPLIKSCMSNISFRFRSFPIIDRHPPDSQWHWRFSLPLVSVRFADGDKTDGSGRHAA
jgi:hypothetical protein